jgi:RNA polymerase sigma-70 factor (ECF subfamily)
MADRKEFDQIALCHLDAVYRAAAAMAGPGAVAEDLAQQTLLNAFRRFDRFRRGTNCRAWLLAILRNLWFDTLRHRKVVGPVAPLDEQYLAAPEAADDPPWTDANDLLEHFADDQVIEALLELPDAQRLALFLVDVEQLSQEEAAEVLDVPVGTVKSRASRARAALRGRLKARARDLGLTKDGHDAGT